MPSDDTTLCLPEAPRAGEPDRVASENRERATNETCETPSSVSRARTGGNRSMASATTDPRMNGRRIHGIAPVVAAFGTIMVVLRPAPAQAPVALDETAVYRTWQVLAIHQACRDAADSGMPLALPETGSSCDYVSRFLQAPLESTPPTAMALGKAFDTAVTVMPTMVASVRTTLGLAPSTKTLTFGAGSLGAAFVSELTEFLLERARDEVVNSFFHDIEKLFANSSTLATAFPRTRRAVQHVDRLGYRTLIPTIHGALRADLQALPENLPRIDALFPEGVPAAVQAASAVAGPIRAIAAGQQPLRALAALASPPSSVSDTALQDALRVVGHLAAELEAGRVLPAISGVLQGLTFDEALAVVVTQPTYRNVLLAFVLQDLGTLHAEVRSLLTTGPGLVDMIARLNDLRAVLDRQADFRYAGTPAERAADVLTAGLQVIHAGALVLPDSSRPALTQGIDVTDALVRALTTQRWGTFVAEVLGLVPVTADGRLVTRLMTLAAAVASSENPEQIKDALHAAADPVGSFRARRTPGGSVAVTAYLGGAVGREWVQDVQATDGSAGTFTGVALPVGVELAAGTGIGLPSSVGLFLSVLDLGTLASYRISNTALGVDSVEATPEYGVAHVLAPGAYLVLGISRSRPLSVGLGLQYAPRLRQVANAAMAPRDAVRLSVFLALDLTLLRF